MAVEENTLVITGASPAILKITEAVLESAIPSFDTKDIFPALFPDKFGVGVKVAKSKAVLIAAKLPDAVKFSEAFPEPPKVIPEDPSFTVPPVMEKVSV